MFWPLTCRQRRLQRHTDRPPSRDKVTPSSSNSFTPISYCHSIRAFTNQLRKFDHNTFHATDFKYVDKQSNKQRLKELKVFPVKEIVTYGFNPDDAPLDKRGIHLKPG